MSKEVKTFLFGAITATVIILLCFKSCGTEKPIIDLTDTLKKQVRELRAKSDSVKTEIVYRDSIRTKIVYKYREIRHDSLIPCETKLLVCDTLLLADSALIFEYKTKAMFDSSIISHQGAIISMDSSRIAQLNKALSKSKLKGKVMFGLGFVAGVGVRSLVR